jgi:excinuclease UvrABC nuclease subunit
LKTSFEKRFGPEYYKRIPETPGVFWFLDSRKNLLLSGHSGNLKNKLIILKNYLKNEQLQSSKFLITRVHEINWMCCQNFDESEKLENKLFNDNHPRFRIESPNTNNFSYIIYNFQKNKMSFSLTDKRNSKEIIFGSFKGKNSTHFTYSALIRWIRFYFHGGSVMSWPSPLNRPVLPTQYNLIVSSEKEAKLLDKYIIDFLNGKSDKLILKFAEKLEPQIEILDKFTRLWLHKDLEKLYYQKHSDY